MPFDRAGTEVLHEHVGALDQLGEYLFAPLASSVLRVMLRLLQFSIVK